MSPGRTSADRLAGLIGSWQYARPVYRGLAESVRLAIVDGRLPPGTALPSERELSRALSTSRTTVAAAYAFLRDAGYLRSRRGAPSRTALPATGDTSESREPLLPADADASAPQLLDLAWASLPAPPGTAAAAERAATALPAYLSGPGYTPRGVERLREILADRYTARGLPTRPDQIVVTHGARQALGLLLRTFVSPGDRVVIEHPTYPNALEAIQQAWARPAPAPLALDGWDLDAVEHTVRQAAPRLAYVVPDFHNPTGFLLDDAGRERLVAILSRARTHVVVDETLVDLTLDVPPTELPKPVAVHDRTSSVTLVGSLGKSHWGGLGVGWIRAPAELVPTLVSARSATDLGAAVLAQLTAVELLTNGDDLLDERRAELRTRRAALAAAVAEQLPQWRFRLPPGGHSLWCELPSPVTASALAAVAEHHGVRLGPGPRFGVDGAFERYVRLPYTLPPEQLDAAVRRIAMAARAVEEGSAWRRPDRVALV